MQWNKARASTWLRVEDLSNWQQHKVRDVCKSKILFRYAWWKIGLQNYLIFREYWEDDQLTYVCKNGTLGVEAADTAFQNFTCIYDSMYGNRFTTPLDVLNQVRLFLTFTKINLSKLNLYEILYCSVDLATLYGKNYNSSTT